MKRILCALILFINIAVFAQENNSKFSFEFNNATITTVIETIEKNSKYKFYFEQEWLDANQNLITESFKNATLEEVLNQVLSQSDINYFIDKNRIILSKNNVIREKLADDYFEKTITENKSENTLNTEKPIFYKENDSTSVSIKKLDKITVIGKESKKAGKKTCIVSGFLKDSKTGVALSDISIKVQNKKISAVTDKDGFYKMTVPVGVNYVEIESLNHIKVIKKIILYNDGTLNVTLVEKVNVLDEVIINAKKSENVKSAVTGVTSIDIEGIKNIPLVLGERDIFKVATILPGVKQTGEGSAGFNVRGGKEDQNLILLDNGIIYNPSHFFGFFSSVNPFTTKKATIYKGSIPPEFGGRLSSVFDITSKNGNPTKFSGEGGIGPVTSNLALSTPIVKDKSSLLVGGRATYSGWILRSIKNESLKNSQASFYDAIIKYNHKINAKNNFESTIYYSHDAFSISSDSVYKYSNRLVSLKWDHTFNEKNKAALIFTNSEYKFNIDYDSSNYLKAFDLGYKINENQVILKLNYNLNDQHKFNYGISTKLYGINPGYLNPKSSESLLIPVSIDKERGLESALYFADNFKVNQKLALDFGLRYSTFSALGASTQRIYQENVPLNEGTIIETRTYKNNEIMKTYGGLEPRFSARYFLADNLSLKASYDKTYQYIHLLSSNTTQSPTDTWKLSDLNVKPQVAQQFSLGLYKNIPKKDIEISLEGYYKKSNNFLDYKVAAQLLLNKNIETQLLQGKGKAYGIEFLIKKNSGRLNGWIGYTYSRTFVKLDSPFNDERVNNGNYFPANFDKPHDISVVLNYRFTRRYSFSSNFIYQTGRPITYPIGRYTYGNSEYTLYSDRNQFRIPDYYRLDIGFNVEGTHKLKKLAHGFWNISIYNVLGRNNPYSIYFVTENGQIKAYKTSIFANPIPTITYNFKF
ncbi:TonB-dependent receptor [Flavobacterium sp. SUN052]|uniref:TonB-dependent receptor n=1 Tax=Flavobacterium sp. SUN052 TaxID=3002441 RepID=UPI00237E8923|nr:TonB-dependent receptor [Flavobacterium sp. SUN052]MEC4003065.1 TonB-dependent receptor [Flavobacterium sp. SUN052]